MSRTLMPLRAVRMDLMRATSSGERVVIGIGSLTSNTTIAEYGYILNSVPVCLRKGQWRNGKKAG